MKTADLIKKSHAKRGAPGTLKRKVKGKMTLAKARALKSKPGATTLDKKQANFFINMHSESNDWVCGQCSCDPCTCESIDEAATPLRRIKLINKIKKSGVVKTGSMKKEAMGGTTTSSVVGAGDNPSGTVVVDKRRRKDKQPKLLKRFRKFIDSDG